MLRECKNGVAFLYARAFLYALDRFDRFLGVLVKTENMSNEIDTLHQGIAVLFPDMRDVQSDYLIGRAFF